MERERGGGGKENRSLYRGLRYKEVRYIEVLLYCYRRKIRIFIFTFKCDQIDQRDTLTRLTPIGNNDARLFKKGGQ